MFKLLGKNRKDPYSDEQIMKMAMPIYFLELCKMLRQEPIGVLFSFMADVGRGHYTAGDSVTISAGTSFIIRKGYDKGQFAEGAIGQMMAELIWAQQFLLSSTLGKVDIEIFEEVRECYLKTWRTKWEALRIKVDNAEAEQKPESPKAKPKIKPQIRGFQIPKIYSRRFVGVQRGNRRRRRTQRKVTGYGHEWRSGISLRRKPTVQRKRPAAAL